MLKGGLSLDQEFALEENIETLKRTIVDLKQQKNTSKSSNILNKSNLSEEKLATNQEHKGKGDNVGGNKITNNYYNNNDEPSKSEPQS